MKRTDRPAAMRAKSGRNRSALVHPTISDYLIQRLQSLGLRTVFGIPGDYVLGFYADLEASPIDVVGTTREDCAGFAADAYARVTGLGCVCVTYCVGGLSVVNSVAGAYAEKSPLLVITGAPGLNERGRNALLHHKVRDFDTQRQVFDKITVANTALEDPLTAFREIDRVLEAVIRYRRPGYIEIPRDMAKVRPTHPHTPTVSLVTSDPSELDEAVAESVKMLSQCERPVIMAGVEIHRFGLQKEVIKLAEKHHIPICSTLLGKSAVSEGHPLYVGVYEGAMGRREVTEFVEKSDCILMLGTFLTDINMGIYTADLDPSHCIVATSEDLRIRYHHYHQVQPGDFIRALARQKFACGKRAIPKAHLRGPVDFVPRKGAKMTVNRLFEKVNTILTEEMIVICDVGDSLFGGADLIMHRHTDFISPAYYTSMGFAVPAALGAQLASPSHRPLVLVGDGAFQMTGMELSTIHRRGLHPIVIVLNNKGYTTERFILDGPFNDIGNWNYHKVTELIGGGWGFEVFNETDLEKALGAALANKDSFSLINVHLDPMDRSEALERLARRLGEKVE
ncbi:alpha-keto acid decarboxylase family protein [bacterium]|nr:alpha-keto acid decarboxylase family protein [bacterium]